jgi:hypothetical protein
LDLAKQSGRVEAVIGVLRYFVAREQIAAAEFGVLILQGGRTPYSETDQSVSE